MMCHLDILFLLLLLNIHDVWLQHEHVQHMKVMPLSPPLWPPVICVGQSSQQTEFENRIWIYEREQTQAYTNIIE